MECWRVLCWVITGLLFIAFDVVKTESTDIEKEQHGVCNQRQVYTLTAPNLERRAQAKTTLQRLAPARPTEQHRVPHNWTAGLGDEPHGHRSRRDVRSRGPRYVELLLVIDNTIVNFHTSRLVEQYIFTLLYLVDEVFHHPSLGIEVNIATVGIERLSDDQKRRLITRNDGRRTLDQFCRWTDQEKRRRRGKDNFDAAVFMTKENIGPAGYAPVTGMCVSTRSCAVVRDDGLHTAFVIAHEIGHIIGMQHDGSGTNRCQRNSEDGKIMGSMVQATYDNYYWTDCSREYMEKYLPGLHCLNNEPVKRNWPRYRQPFGQSWTMDEQCRQEFGDQYVLCRAIYQGRDPCQALWCGLRTEQSFCKTKRSAPLAGTSCGRGKWCMDRRCQAKRNVVVHGGWAPWTSWGSCSRTCGGGVRFRARTCTRPRPRYGGYNCRGARESYELCNTRDCEENVDIRQQLCTRQNSINFYDRKRHNWLPHETNIEPRLCHLTCVSEEYGDVMTEYAPILDGVFCSYERAYDVCVRGRCRRAGCDKKFNSRKRADICGVCEGDGSTCTRITGHAARTLGRKEYHHLVILPPGSRNIDIREHSTMPHLAFYLAVRDVATEKWHLNGQANRTKESTSFVLHGTNFHFYDRKQGERLYAKGPLLQPVEIMVYSWSPDLSAQISYSFLVPLEIRDQLSHYKPNVEQNRYIWTPERWNECSRSCGGGVKYQEFMCMDTKVHTIEPGMCLHSEQPTSVKALCNEHSCHYRYRWEGGAWEQSCSASCGDSGVQRRLLRCLMYVGPGREREVSPRYCHYKAQPPTEQPCNHIPCTSPEWVTEEWSECSVTCGTGQQLREVFCDQQYAHYAPYYMCIPGDMPPSARRCVMTDCSVAILAPTTSVPVEISSYSTMKNVSIESSSQTDLPTSPDLTSVSTISYTVQRTTVPSVSTTRDAQTTPSVPEVSTVAESMTGSSATDDQEDTAPDYTTTIAPGHTTNTAPSTMVTQQSTGHVTPQSRSTDGEIHSSTKGREEEPVVPTESELDDTMTTTTQRSTTSSRPVTTATPSGHTAHYSSRENQLNKGHRRRHPSRPKTRPSGTCVKNKRRLWCRRWANEERCHRVRLYSICCFTCNMLL